MNNTKFSIIMPTYNRAYCIQNAIDSLLAQTYQNFELIIIDDGSDDNTEKIIKENYFSELNQKKIIYKKNSKNKGVSNARNTGLKLAKNEWIGYLDTDNTMSKEFLKTFKNAIEKNSNKIFYAQIQDDNQKIVGKLFNYQDLCNANYIDMGVFVHHKSLIRKCGKFDTKLKRLVDWDLIIRYTKNNEPYFIEKILLNYSNHQNYPRISNTESFENAKKYISNKISTSVLEQLFSVKNDNQTCHKIVCILGIKLKFKSKRLKEKKEELSFKNNLVCSLHNIELLEKENFYANILRDCTADSSWLKDKSFTLTGGAANYSLIFTIFKILDDIEPINILEFGLGQTSKVTTQYILNKKPNANLMIIEHDNDWINTFKKKLILNENIKICQRNIIKTILNNTEIDKYDCLKDIIKNQKLNFIIIDGPFGDKRIYPRTNILDLIPENLAENFIIVLDDAERSGEQNTAKLIFNKLEENRIKYIKSYKSGIKTQLLITSSNYKFIHWI